MSGQGWGEAMVRGVVRRIQEPGSVGRYYSRVTLVRWRLADEVNNPH